MASVLTSLLATFDFGLMLFLGSLDFGWTAILGSMRQIDHLAPYTVQDELVLLVSSQRLLGGYDAHSRGQEVECPM